MKRPLSSTSILTFCFLICLSDVQCSSDLTVSAPAPASGPHSPSGEANLGEVLYKLAVNFLLYVVLITVFYMVVRFYLEEETDAYYFKSTPSSPVKQSTFDLELTHGSLRSHSRDYSETEPSGDEAKDDAPLLHFDDKLESSHGPPSPLRTSSVMNLLAQVRLATSNDWEDQERSKQEVLQQATFCLIGLNVCFCCWGLLQERMLTLPYGEAHEYFVNNYGLVFFTRLGGLALSAFLMWRFEVQWVSSPLYEFSFPSVANMLSSWCQYEALKYVSFPTQVLAKAFKLVPVMLMGKFLYNKSYESYEYTTAATIGFGIYVFLYSSENLDLSRDFWNNPDGGKGTVCGVVLLLLFLFFDSFTGQWQTRMFKIHRRMSPVQMMLVINAFSAVFSFVTLLHQEELFSTLAFVYTHPEMMLHLVLFCIFGTVGQLFIFYTVKQFGAVVFSIFMSVRILISILLSCFVFSHPFTELGVIGIMIVFCAITYRIKRKNEDMPLFTWKESMQMNKVIFNEWHEHVDM